MASKLEVEAKIRVVDLTFRAGGQFCVFYDACLPGFIVLRVPSNEAFVAFTHDPSLAFPISTTNVIGNRRTMVDMQLLEDCSLHDGTHDGVHAGAVTSRGEDRDLHYSRR